MLRRGGFVLVVVILLVAATGFTASLAAAGGSADALIDDASDGVVDGSYSIAVVRTALSVVRSDPVYSQYSDIEGVLVDYLATLTQSDGGGSGVDKPSTPAPTTPTPTPTSVKTSPSPRPTHTKAGTGKTQAEPQGRTDRQRTPQGVQPGALGGRLGTRPCQTGGHPMVLRHRGGRGRGAVWCCCDDAVPAERRYTTPCAVIVSLV